MHVDKEHSGAGLVPVLLNEHAARGGVRAADANGGPGHSVDRQAEEPQWEAAPDINLNIQQPAAVPEAGPAPSRPAPAEPAVLQMEDCAAGAQQHQHGIPGGGAAVEAQIGPSAAHEQIAKPEGGPAAENNVKEDLPNQVRQCAFNRCICHQNCIHRRYYRIASRDACRARVCFLALFAGDRRREGGYAAGACPSAAGAGCE